MTDLDIACRCGKLGGTLQGAPDSIASRVICYCSSCRTFAQRLGREDVLDAHGGTDICQLSSAQLTISRGREHLACLRLTDNGPLRWYAACCDTPLANTPPTAQMPFAGVLRAVLSGDEDSLRPVDFRVMTKYAVGGAVEEGSAHAGFPLAQFMLLVPRMLRWRLRGDHRRSPFFDPETGAPVAEPALPGGR